ncbi:hypothetical protein DES53_12516 [Roseimicrobium gellanilyticum]|uniref:Uncharacterized protein n=1 Tax=Roseimicrobium gellanilyticum TaxID=748857 RepID=A0A366H042_9BACT|nr:hypothetical protein DES53_12516 [Roseimicrobium gellanilyticum]
MFVEQDFPVWSRLRRPTVVKGPSNHIDSKLHLSAVDVPVCLDRQEVTAAFGSHGTGDYSPQPVTWL